MLDKADREALLAVAAASIRHGLAHDSPLGVAATEFSLPLQAVRATFVTLSKDERLRGCIGGLEAVRTLVEDVDVHAFAAAFRDPRFPRLMPEELVGLDIHIAILSPPEPLAVDSEEELLAQLRPHIDGLILQEGRSRATFLPSVWETLPEPRLFLSQLKLKARLPVNYWSDEIRLFRYTTESFDGAVSARAVPSA